MTAQHDDVLVVGPAQPDESTEQYARRVANAAPSPSADLCARLARLLPLPNDGGL